MEKLNLIGTEIRYVESFGAALHERHSEPMHELSQEFFDWFVDEVNKVAARSERYRAAWEILTPDSALTFCYRQASHFFKTGSRYDEIESSFQKVGNALLTDMRLVALRIQEIVDEARTIDDIAELTQRCDTWLQTEMFDTTVANDFLTCVTAFKRMLSSALNVRQSKLTSSSPWSLSFPETTHAIEQIRKSQYADETVYWVRCGGKDGLLPPAFARRNRPGASCLALTVSDEWLASFPVTSEPPALATAMHENGQKFLVLEFAAGTIRLDAARVADAVRYSQDGLPILLIGMKSCLLYEQPFTNLIDLARIDNALRDFKGFGDSLPLRNRDSLIPSGSTTTVFERYRLFDGTYCQDLTQDPDSFERAWADDVPF